MHDRSEDEPLPQNDVPSDDEPPFEEPPFEPLPDLVPSDEPEEDSRYRDLVAAVGMVAAWTAIGLGVLTMVALRYINSSARQGAGRDGVVSVTTLIQARYIVGAARFIKALNPSQLDQLTTAARAINTGPVDQRLRFVVLMGELQGPKEALTELDAMEKKAAEQDVKLTPTQTRLCNTLELLYTDYSKDALNAPSVNEPARDLLRSEMGWFGDLALAPEGADAGARDAVLAPASWTMVIFVGAAVFIAVAGFVGLFGLVVFGVLLAFRKLRGGLSTGGGHGGVYAEAFAVWFVLFSTALVGGAYLPLPSAARLPVQSLVMLSSLMAVGWPVLRGVPWSVVRREIGWTLGRRPWLEPLLGPPCYLMSLPILAVGLVATLILMKLSGMPGLGLLADATNDFRVPDTAGHPIVGVVASGTWYERLVIFWLASFVAPVVEETMFRGVLYRHLRELTGVAGPWVSVLFSGTVVSFIFAVIHPQGWVAVPVLMAMAYGFTIAREWRETLIPAMVAHGLNNGLVLGLLILVLSR